MTGRRQLTALRGMLPLAMDIMPPGQAADLFTRVSGRGGSEAGAVAELVELAGRLPLAIQMLGARLQSRRSWTVADLAGEPAAARDRSAAIGAADEPVRAVFDLSYRTLSTQGSSSSAISVCNLAPASMSTPPPPSPVSP